MLSCWLSFRRNLRFRRNNQSKSVQRPDRPRIWRCFDRHLKRRCDHHRRWSTPRCSALRVSEYWSLHRLPTLPCRRIVLKRRFAVHCDIRQRIVLCPPCLCELCAHTGIFLFTRRPSFSRIIATPTGMIPVKKSAPSDRFSYLNSSYYSLTPSSIRLN